MIAKELLLGSSFVNVVEQRVLVERHLRRNAEVQLSSQEVSAVDLVLGQSAFYSAA